MKRFLLLVGISISVMMSWAETWYDPSTGREWGYSVKNGEVEIRGAYPSEGDLVIPATIDSYPVVAVTWIRRANGCGEPDSLLNATTLTIPASVRKVEMNHLDASSLESITVDKANKYYSSKNGLLCSKDGKSVILGINGDVQIPSGVTHIDSNAFSGCQSLSSVTIPSSVEYIGSYAFYNCESLTFLTIPASVTKIADLAFEGCRGMWSFIVDSANKNYSSLNGMLCSKDGKTLIKGVNRDVVIPNGIIQIGGSAFRGFYDVTSIMMPSSVKRIESCAFEDCYSLSSVIMSRGVEYIGSCAFYNCESLIFITIPSSVEYIGSYAFYNCESLISITISSSVKRIESWVFAYCRSLSSVSIPNGVEYIGWNAFYNCESLTSLTIPASVTKIDNSAFEGCDEMRLFFVDSANKNYSSLNGMLGSKDGKILIKGVNGEGVIPYGVTTICNSSFDGFRELTSVTIPSSVTNIGSSAFRSCAGLTSVIIPYSVKSLGDYAFAGCYNLSSVTIPSSVEEIGNGAFSGTPFLNNQPDGCVILGHVLHQYKGTCPAQVTIPESVWYIGSSAFSYCRDLKSVIFPKGLMRIGSCAFEECKGLSSVVLPQGLLSIGSSAFARCEGLVSVVLPQGLLTIGSSAFANCDGLTSVVLPQGLLRVEDYAFSGCDSMISVTVPSSVRYIGNHAFRGNSLSYFYVDSANTQYCAMNGMLCRKSDKVLLCGVNGHVVIPQGVTRIADGAFDSFDGLLSVTIPGSVNAIGSHAFCYCYNLQSVSIPGSVKTIGDCAFYHCYNLQSITLGPGLTEIGEEAFTDCISLNSIILPSGLTRVDAYAFYGCENLSSVSIPSSLTSLGENGEEGDGGVFSDTPFYENQPDGFVIFNHILYKYKGTCPSVVTIPSGVTQIAAGAFEDQLNLTSVKMPDSVTYIGEYAFWGCENLTTVTIPNTLSRVGGGAFEGTPFFDNRPDGPIILGHVFCGYHGTCPDSVVIPTYVTSIGKGAFEETAITTITIPISVTNIEGYAFKDCDDLTSIIIPDSVTHIGRYAFTRCDHLTSVTLPKSLTCLEEGVFDRSGLVTVTIPPQVTEIKEYAFGDCENLVSVTIPSSVRYIDSDAFLGCDSLQVIYVDKGDAARIKSLMEGNNLEGLQYVERGSPITSSCEVVFDAGEEGVVSESTRQVTAGKTLGTLPTATRAHYLLDGWYTEPTGGSKITANTKVTADCTFYAHWVYNGQVMVTPRVAEEQAALGSVSGGGKPAKGGTKVTLKATAKKGAAFAGWYLDDELVSTSASYTFVAGEEDVILEAYFIAAAEDYLYAWSNGELYFDLKESVDFDLWNAFGYESGSTATYSFAGLPTGIKFDTKTQRFVGAPTKTGLYVVMGTFKNANGYSQTIFAPWHVGDVSLPEEYDDIGLDWEWTEDDEGLYVGLACQAAVYYTAPDSTAKLSISGLPTGLRATIAKNGATGPAITIAGTPTKAGIYTLTITETRGRETNKYVRNLWVEDRGSEYITVLCAPGEETRGLVKGEGVYAAGATVRLTAQAAKGYYFAGWYLDAECSERADFGSALDYRAASPSFVYAGAGMVEMDRLSFYARFVTAEEDSEIDFACSDVWEVDTSESRDAFSFAVWSETAVKVSVKGLPSGMKYDGVGSITISDVTKVKPGTSVMTLTAQNLSKASVTQEVLVVVPNLVSEWIAVADDYGEFKPGVPLTLDLESEGYWEDYTSFSVAGLPKGLVWNTKDDARKDVWAHTITGAPTTPGVYTITFTAKGKAFGTAVATSTLTVLPFPKLTVLLADDAPKGAKVTGAGAYAANTKVTLKATAPKGYVFAGWFGVDVPYPDYLNPTLTYVTGESDTVIEANFVPQAEDGLYVEIDNSFDWYVGDPLEMNVFDWAIIETASYPTVSVKGLPTGIKFDAKSGRLTGTCTKSGVSYATFTFKNASGYICEKVVRFEMWPLADTPDEEILARLGVDVESLREIWAGSFFETDLGLSGYLPDGFKVSGLPTGLTWSAKEGFISGTPTKVGAYTVKFSAKDPDDSRKTLSAQMTCVVQGFPSRYIAATVAKGSGSVSGAGLYAAGAAIKLTAKPAKNEVFVGWYYDAECTERLSLGASDYRDMALTGYANQDTPTQVYAAFAPIEEDQAQGVALWTDGDWYVDAYDTESTYWIEAESLSLPTVTVQKLPAGMVLKKEYQEGVVYYTLRVTDGNKLKAGFYTVTLTAQNQSKQKAVESITIEVSKY